MDSGQWTKIIEEGTGLGGSGLRDACPVLWAHCCSGVILRQPGQWPGQTPNGWEEGGGDGVAKTAAGCQVTAHQYGRAARRCVH